MIFGSKISPVNDTYVFMDIFVEVTKIRNVLPHENYPLYGRGRLDIVGRGPTVPDGRSDYKLIGDLAREKCKTVCSQSLIR